jgi:hypothetical protein
MFYLAPECAAAGRGLDETLGSPRCRWRPAAEFTLDENDAAIAG